MKKTRIKPKKAAKKTESVKQPTPSETEKKLPQPQTADLLSATDIIGKPLEQFEFNDIDPAAKGCPVAPLHDKKAILEGDYLLKLRGYFPFVNSRDIMNYLLDIDMADKEVSKKIRSYGVFTDSVRIGRAEKPLYAMAAFVNWAKGPNAALDYLIKREAKANKPRPQKGTAPATIVTTEDDKSVDEVKTAPATEPTVEPVQESIPESVAEPTTEPTELIPLEESVKVKGLGIARIELDTTSHLFSAAVVWLYNVFPQLIVTFNHEGDYAYLELDIISDDSGLALKGFMTEYYPVILYYNRKEY